MIATGLQLPSAPAPQSGNYTVGGLMGAQSLGQLQRDEEKAARERADAANNTPVVQNLVGHINRHWTLARDARRITEQEMLQGVRALRGEYDPDKLAKLREQNSSEIYMMLFASKARQAKALLGDVILGTQNDKPWSLVNTPEPNLPPDIVASIIMGAQQLVAQAEQGPAPMTMAEVRQLLQDAKTQATAEMAQEAKLRCERAERKLDDMLQEGGFIQALDQILDDMMVFPTVFLKGPVVRRKGKLVWEKGIEGTFEPVVTTEAKPCWERVDPLMIYPAPWARSVNDSYLIERHKLSPESLSELIGVDGYSDDAIRQVLDEHGIGGLHRWLAVDSERSLAEGRHRMEMDASSDLIDALQYWGTATGKLLIEWGMSKEEVTDEAKVYQIEAWLIGRWVIKAVINSDPLSRRPYYADSFKKQPGAFWGLSLYNTMADCQDMCNGAARAMANNLGIASGPQVWVNVDRLPNGEDITTMYPWKIWQTTSDPMGGTAPPMAFFQPQSNAGELMAVYEKYSTLADEHTGIPRYMTGDGAAGGAGRTATGMSMMVGNAGKTVKSTVKSLDMNIIGPAVERGYEYIMRYVEDPDIKGDLQVVARGALSLMTKDAAQVRRNEFMGLALQSPIVQQLIGPEGIASLLRAMTSTLDLDTTSIVPSDSEIRIKMAAMQKAAMEQQAQQQQAIQGPTASAELGNGAPVADNFGA